MRILVTGSHGMIGSALVARARGDRHEVVRLVRPGRAAAAGGIPWDIARGQVDPAGLEGFDAVVHLAGENIAGRWTAAKKASIRDSRIRGTSLLSDSIRGLARPPRVLVCASAVGFYGSRGDELLDESAAAGRGFLAEVCRDWEAAAAPARARGIRVVHLRFGMVLSPAGGALAKMLLPFRMGLGGRVGSGLQYMSWISLDDAVGILLAAVESDRLTGPVNAVTPEPVTNREFTRILGKVLNRPTLLPMPAFAVRLLFGEMGESLLLGSVRVRPGLLQAAGHPFQYPELAPALRHLLGREGR
ncbi:MAG: TIGR01777 family oxidoreductase [Acidobacteria bacterium]|nr:TIGR01777 family oxidoreductase [Acidobacteriota bacterium]